ncbi:DUF4190 domain-containing protein [Amycolatopsis mongoliensis]|uniref:DUF4190 domain-containing protein n=1 Tax=Amycolatopsis mongoliensis TaxID=715475 RepID=A0A9Y2NIX6_9PSEU|nr:DUF4190 domain-containing protein [Amycolatopsis sp. 4-36]WIY03389.1 DUF4190 domain-containing protein [Amycolatopsis sp. 4-36]
MSHPYDPDDPFGRRSPSGGLPPDPGGPPGPGLAAGALLCSVAGGLVCLPAGIAGVVMGHAAHRRARRGEAAGRGVAIAAIAVGYLGIGLNTVALVLLFRLGAAHGLLR